MVAAVEVDGARLRFAMAVRSAAKRTGCREVSGLDFAPSEDGKDIVATAAVGHELVGTPIGLPASSLTDDLRALLHKQFDQSAAWAVKEA